jgi:hypothetical protein
MDAVPAGLSGCSQYRVSPRAKGGIDEFGTLTLAILPNVKGIRRLADTIVDIFRAAFIKVSPSGELWR